MRQKKVLFDLLSFKTVRPGLREFGPTAVAGKADKELTLPDCQIYRPNSPKLGKFLKIKKDPNFFKEYSIKSFKKYNDFHISNFKKEKVPKN